MGTNNSNRDSPLVYIIVLNWNGYEDSRKCLESLLEVEYEPFKVLLVDNASEGMPNSDFSPDLLTEGG